LFSTELKILHHVLHWSLGRSTPLMPTLQVIHDTPLDLSTLPSCVSKENCDGFDHVLSIRSSLFNQNLSPQSTLHIDSLPIIVCFSPKSLLMPLDSRRLRCPRKTRSRTAYVDETKLSILVFRVLLRSVHCMFFCLFRRLRI